MVSPVDICNLALDNIGARFSITSISPPSPPPNAALVARQYAIRINALFRAAHWNALRRQTRSQNVGPGDSSLSLIRAAQGTPENPAGTTLPIPPPPWQYSYLLPADCLKARYILPNPPQSGSSPIPILAGGFIATPTFYPPTGYKFVVGIDVDSAGNQIKVLLTDLEYAELVYTANIQNPDLWDPSLQNAAAATLGAWLVNSINRNSEILKEQISIATEIIKQARVSDGNEGVTSLDHSPDWMAVRGFSGYEWVATPQSYYGYEGMFFPGGIFV